LPTFGPPTTAPELVELDAPSPGAGQVLVRLEAAPINPSDLLLIAGRYGVRPALPAALGSEGVGRLVAAGAGVDPNRVGERVLIVPGPEHGTWRELTVVDQRNVVRVDPEADPHQLAMVGVNPVTADRLLSGFTTLTPGAWVGQTGANSGAGH